jgi:hypothetical protein
MNNSNSNDAVLLNSQVQRQAYVWEEPAGILEAGGGMGHLTLDSHGSYDSVSLFLDYYLQFGHDRCSPDILLSFMMNPFFNSEGIWKAIGSNHAQVTIHHD